MPRGNFLFVGVGDEATIDGAAGELQFKKPRSAVAFNLVCASILGNDLFGADFCVK